MKNIKEYLGSDERSIKLYHKSGELALSFIASLVSESWDEFTYDRNGRTLTYKNSNDYWSRYIRDNDGRVLTFENSRGGRIGFDIEEMTMEEVCIALGRTIKITK